MRLIIVGITILEIDCSYPCKFHTSQANFGSEHLSFSAHLPTVHGTHFCKEKSPLLCHHENDRREDHIMTPEDNVTWGEAKWGPEDCD